jgi:FkbM family methyltransferase
MISKHPQILIKYLFQEDPSKLIFRRFIFKSYLLIYSFTESLVGSRLSTKILKSIRKIKLKTKLKTGYLVYHKIEHIPYLYDIYNSKEEVKIGKNKIILDIGAHMGSFSLKYAEDNKLYAFEPNRENYSFLEKNVKNNQLNKKIIIFNFAISDKKGIKRLGLSEGSGGHGFYTKSKNHEKVETFTLDEFIKIKKIKHVDIIKIDVEGDELNVLKGAIKLLGKMSPLLIIELHPWYISAKKILEKLEKEGYKIDSMKGLKIYASKKDK